MFWFKYRRAIDFIDKENYDEAFFILSNLINKNKNKPELYVSLAKVLLTKGKVKEAKIKLQQMLSIKGWYKKGIIKDILEITNWKMLVENKFFCKEPCFSPDGEKILFIMANKDTNEDDKINNSDRCGIYQIDRTGKSMTCLVEDKYYNSSAKFSPDNKYIVFLSARRDTNNDNKLDNHDDLGMYILNLVTGEEKLLVEDVYKPKHPSFSPDGKKIIFTCWRSPGSFSGVYEIEIETLNIKTLVRETYENAFPSYSPDGSRIVYSSWRDENLAYGSVIGKSAIYVKDLYSMSEICISSDKYINSFPIFSNKGRYIAYLSKRRDTNNDGVINSLDNDGLYIYDLCDKKEFLINSDMYYNKYANFTFDDKNIIFLSNYNENYNKKTEKSYFDFKGICKSDCSGKKKYQIVSNKYNGCVSLEVSKTRDEIVYVSFRRDTLRGLYLAYLKGWPSKEEIVEIINKNLI